MIWLLADLGGTNCRCALTDGESITAIREYVNREYDSLDSLLEGYRRETPGGDAIAGAALAVAAPVLGDRVSMSNMPWEFSRKTLKAALSLPDFVVINDFEALAWSLPGLGADDLRAIGVGASAPGGTMAVVGPGTGLGVAGLVADAHGGWHAISGEGGNITLPASNDRETGLIAAVRQRDGHCSAEQLISGRGLSLLHELMHGEPGLSPEAIGQRIDAGNAAAIETLDQCFAFLGTVAGNVALTLGATGGVFIGGGIVPRYADRFAMSGFRDRFEDCGRYRDYMRQIPTNIITRRLPAFEGLRHYLTTQL